jgi:spore coat polysaccharide biosynthesis protein SpsF
MTRRVVAIIQARMGSSRLPGKVLLDIAGEPMLGRVVVRVSRSVAVDEILVATTTDPADQPVDDFCRSRRISCLRGSQFDVLDRYYHAALQYRAELIVRITADCPAIDPALIDEVVETVTRDWSSVSNDHYAVDFAANRLPPPWKRSYPIGLDTEVCTFAALARAWKEGAEAQHREHVMPYLYEGVQLSPVSPQLSVGESPRGFGIALLNHVPDYGGYRWTVDTAEDLEFIRQVYDRFNGSDDFSWTDLLELVHNEPRLMEINAGVTHKTLRDIDKRAL